MLADQPAPRFLVTVRENVCTNGWPYRRRGHGPLPLDHYNGGCFCDRDAGHKGRCRCPHCGSTRKARKEAPDVG